MSEARPNPLVTALDRLFAGHEDAFALGLLRAIVAGILCLTVLLHVGKVGEYFSDESMIYGRSARLAFPDRFSVFDYVGDPTAVRAIWALGVAALALWTVGLFTRLSGAIGMLVWISMFGRNHLLYAYPDQLAMMLGLLLVLMPAGRGFSLDARWRGRGGTVPIWCRRLIQLQLAIVYAVTGLEKTGDAWRVDGTAIYYTLTNPYNRHFDAGPLFAALQPWLLEPMTFAVLGWELLFGPFVAYHWIRDMLGRRIAKLKLPDARGLFLGFGAATHLGIQIAVYVLFFSPLIVGAYVSYYDSDELRRAGAWLRRSGRRLLPSRA